MKKNLIILFAVVVVSLLIWAAYFRTAETPGWLPGNPASLYCTDGGDKSEIKTLPDGSQYGICKFNDGTECEEWEYLRGTCKPGQYKSREFKSCVGDLQPLHEGEVCCKGLEPEQTEEGSLRGEWLCVEVGVIAD